MVMLNKRDLKKVETIMVYKATCPECGVEMEITSVIFPDNYFDDQICPGCGEFIGIED